MDRAGVEFPKVQVRFENLAINAGIQVGDRNLPTLVNATLNLFENLLIKTRLLKDNKRDFPILHSISGTLVPGRMTLLLGPPGAGKSTLMKALAGKLDSDLHLTGSITYNGHTLNEFMPSRTASYVSQDDLHIGEMTVRETLDFSARVQGVGHRATLRQELEKREAELNIVPDPVIAAYMKGASLAAQPATVQSDYLIKMLGLDVCQDTVVGNELLRGISGGQKKRVTTGEQLVGPRQVLFLDEISTGLDSSTTFQITQSMGHWTRKQNATVLIALLQPAPETYDLFDDIILLSEGHIVYNGPKEHVLEFFTQMGFKCPARKGVADFLQEVTGLKDQRQYWADKRAPYRYVAVKDFADAFETFSVGQENRALLNTPYDKSQSPPGALGTARWGVPETELFKAVCAREFLLMKRNSIFYIASTIQAPSDHQGRELHSRRFFFGMLMMLFNGLAEMSMMVQRLPVFFRQRGDFYFPSWCLIVPSWVLTLPFSVWASFLWTVLIYWTIGLAPDAGRFFRHVLILFLIHQCSCAIFKVIGALARTMTIANTFGGFGLLVVLIMGGFVLAKPDIHPWWIWGYWCSPLSYAQNALAVNEFLDPRWNGPAGRGYQPNQSIGYAVLHGRGLYTRGFWYWIGFAALIGFIIVFNLILIVALQFIQPLAGAQAQYSEEQLMAKEANRTGKDVDTILQPSKRSGTGAISNRLEQLSKIGQKSTLGQMSSLSGGNSSLGQNSSLTPEEAGQQKRGMVLPFVPLALSFRDVNYFVTLPGEMKAAATPEQLEKGLQLLRNVNGAFRPGILTALVGVSGAGKTTLMDVLADRKTGGTIEGDVRVSGYPKKRETFARIAGYCEQNDIHSPQVTVRESLKFSAWLRLPADVDVELREAFVDEVMDLVELTPLRDALVGRPGQSGLSTEQRKRLTIAVELVANPSIIFMDEPTSGLDARAAAIVMRTVRNTVNTGRTVVCTIHQPSIDIFEAFDELLLMKRGGQVIYMGPLGRHSAQLVAYFEAIPGVPKIRDGYNPATWMLEVSTTSAEQHLGVDFAEVFRNSEQHSRLMKIIEDLSVPPEGHKDLSFPSIYSQSWPVQFTACLWKWRQTYWRTPEYNVVRYFYTLTVALLIGTIFWNLGSKRSTQQDVLNVMGALYAASLFLGWSNAASVQPIVFIERPVYYRERAAGMYSALPYTLAQATMEIPYVVIQSILYALVTYAMVQFQWTAEKFFWYLLFTFLTLWYFLHYGMMAIAITPNEQLAAVLSAFFFSWWNLFSGFLIPRPDMPRWWTWYYYLNPVAWTLYGLIGSQLGDVTTTITAPGQDDTTVKHFLSSYFGFEHNLLGAVAAALLGFVFGFWLIYAYAVKTLVLQSR
eukprot:SM000165S02187  [mRNA]  locus=s165:830:10558:+ [translate_table: standard]